VSLRIEEAAEPTPELAAALERLLPQLSPSVRAPAPEELEEIVRSPATTVLLARDGDAIVGTLTLALFRTPYGLHAWIEDVVGDEAARGRGAGEALVRDAIARAEAAGAGGVDLTSRPHRQAAIALYERIGFVRRETGVFRYAIS
jgi:ribosomal protein S18 acetylase RimI-like enzyme